MTNETPTGHSPAANSVANSLPRPAPLSAIERRILGVLMEKARTTPEAYPLTLNSLTTGCNQKSNRAPLMNLSMEQVEDAIGQMRLKQLAAEVHAGGRVAKYRHLGYDYLGVRGVEAGVMTELLLRGHQTVGELRTRASRFDPIADLAAMQQILNSLEGRGLVIALTPAGRGQSYSHNFYQPAELEGLKSSLAGYNGDSLSGDFESAAEPLSAHGGSRTSGTSLQADLQELREMVAGLQRRVTELETRLDGL